MDYTKLRIIIWNVRGLNSRARRIGIRSLVHSADASIVCFQETKMELLHSRIVLETLGPDFDDYVYLPADGTRGGILLAWKSRDLTITEAEFIAKTITTVSRARRSLRKARRLGGSRWSTGRRMMQPRLSSSMSFRSSGLPATSPGSSAETSSSSCVTKTRTMVTSIVA
jgi:exonuclease III